MRKILLLLILVCFGYGHTYAQTDSLMDMLNDGGQKKKKETVSATFKATRIIDGSSVENLGKGTLDFRIMHRFGRLSEGTDNFFGLDNATTMLGLDYGITKWLMVGVSHSTLEKTNEGFTKIKLLPQQKKGMPITLSYYGNIEIRQKPVIPAGDKYYFSNRMSFTNQLLIARKFSDRLSLQLTPTLVHQNLVDSSKFSNNTFALGIGGRIKVSKRIAITGDYYYRFSNADLLADGRTTYNVLSVGIDIETGGHVFQLMLSNAAGMTERSFITQTTDNWSKGQLHFGFNISRVFTVVKPKEFRNPGGKEW